MIVSKKKVISSVLWKLLERIGLQFFQFFISIILARLLTPSDYGVVALITIFIQIATVFIQSGFGTALVQKKDADNLDFSSVFYSSLAISIILYVILFFSAPLIASFYKNKLLIPIIRVLSITLIFGSINGIQYAKVSKTMEFKKFFFSSMGGSVGSSIIGIYLAFKGAGPWALVFQQLFNSFLITLILWFTVDWHPSFQFSFSRVKELFTFSWKLLVSSLLDTLFRNIHGLIIGKTFSSESLGLFNRGQQFPQILTSSIDGSIQSVLLPTYSAHNDNKEKIKSIARQSISLSSFLLIPMMFGLAAIAKPLVLLLLTEKWLGCVPFLQLACISFALYPIHTTNLTAINSIGRSDIFLKLEIIKKSIIIVSLFITVPLGIIPMAIGQVVTSFIATFINARPNKFLINYSYKEQIEDMLPSFILSVIMFVVISFFRMLSISPLILVILQIITGITVYAVLSLLFNRNIVNLIISFHKEFKKNENE